MKKEISKFIVGAFILFFLSNCASSGFGAGGVILTYNKIGVYGSEVDGTKRGKACTDSYLGLVAVGDGSVQEAAKKQNITKIKIINLESFSILGLYASLCTIVVGD